MRILYLLMMERNNNSVVKYNFEDDLKNPFQVNPAFYKVQRSKSQHTLVKFYFATEVYCYRLNLGNIPVVLIVIEGGFDTIKKSLLYEEFKYVLFDICSL